MNPKAPKTPKLTIPILYVSRAGRKIVQAEPVGDTITIGNETATIRDGSILPGKGKFQAVMVQGRPELVNFFGEAENGGPTAAEFDAVAHDNLLEQLRNSARRDRTQAVNWIQVGLSFLVVLALIGGAVKLHGDLEDLRQDMENMHVDPATGQPYGNGAQGDRTVVNPGGGG